MAYLYTREPQSLYTKYYHSSIVSNNFVETILGGIIFTHRL